jgi:hypothetical protein
MRPSKRPPAWVAAIAAVIILSTFWPGTAAGSAPRFVTGPMPPDPSRPHTWAWEPGLAMDASGSIWVAGNHCAIVDQHGLCQAEPAPDPRTDYTPLWRSSDGGLTYRFAGDPLRDANVGQDRPGGNDTDVAVAPVGRAGRPPLVYVTSLWGVSSTLAISGDDGRTWRLAQLSGVPVQDRPWLATSGPCDLYLAYHPLTGAANVASVARVDRYDGCSLFADAVSGQVVATPVTSTLVQPPPDEASSGDEVIAKTVAVGRDVYVAYLACDTAPQGSDCTGAPDRESVHVAVSRDRAATFTDVALPSRRQHGTLSDGTWPISAAADSTGRVAVAVTDARHVWLWTSRDAGRTWRRRNAPVDGQLGWKLAVVPSVALHGRTLAVAWYGSGPARGAQRWRLVVAVSRDDGRTLRMVVLPQVLATTPHDASLADGLYDDFGLGITPGGHVVAAYTASCLGHRPRDRSCPGPNASDLGTTDVIRSAWIR